MDNINLIEDELKGILLNRDTDEFSIIGGDFNDKRDMVRYYEDDYVPKAIYEKEVFDWIEENAKSAVDAYLLFSVAYRKWKNNNLLKGYYEKLLKDIPRLFPDSLDDEFSESTNNSSKINNIITKTLQEAFNK